MHRLYPPANYLNPPLKRQQTKAVAGRKLKKREERSRRNDKARAAKQRQLQQDSRDRRAQHEANDRADQERRDQGRRHRETLSANQRASYTHNKTPHYIKEAQYISSFFYSSFGWSGEPFDDNYNA